MNFRYNRTNLVYKDLLVMLKLNMRDKKPYFWEKSVFPAII